MTPPTDLDRAVERVRRALDIADRYNGGGIQFGETEDGHLSFDDLRTILTALSAEREASEVLEALEPTPPSTGNQKERMKGEGTP